jgi:endonuclease/exonuclease/phosphatase (EEP) superfamily protein YafD
VEAYRQKELCQTTCSRTDVRIPVLIAGDFNGTPQGSVSKLLHKHGYKNAYDSVAATKWVSHHSHENKDLAVDHIFVHNPTDQGDEAEVYATPVPDWTNMVYDEVPHAAVIPSHKNS